MKSVGLKEAILADFPFIAVTGKRVAENGAEAGSCRTIAVGIHETAAGVPVRTRAVV
jgi:hypothetical protein